MSTEEESLALIIEGDDAGKRIDAFLAARTGVSRTRLQRAIEDGDVTVNGRPVKSNYKLRDRDELDVELPAPVATALIPQEIPLNILFEDAAVIVLDKPAGLVVHPAAGIADGTLANALAFHLSGDGPGEALRPGLVHRLDRDTSGVMVVAKTDAALEHLADQFRDRTVEKHYLALVHGRVEKKRGTIDAPLARDRKNRLKMCVATDGRASLSLYTVLRRFDEFTLLDVEIKTGRTHQIRVHCAHIGHPVVADPVYGEGRGNSVKNTEHRRAMTALGRQFLHAARLAFTHPTSGERLKFEAPLPAALDALLETL